MKTIYTLAGWLTFITVATITTGGLAHVAWLLLRCGWNTISLLTH